jgi:hypothetical protein
MVSERRMKTNGKGLQGIGEVKIFEGRNMIFSTIVMFYILKE